MRKTITATVFAVAILTLSACTAPAQSAAPEPSTSSEPTTIYIVRHGEAWFNVQDVVSGWSDSFLTTKGEQQAATAGEALGDIEFDAILTSDLGRARHTARLIAEANASDTEITDVMELREHHTGGLDGHLGPDVYIPIMESMGFPYDPAQKVDESMWTNPTVIEWVNSVDQADFFDAVAAADETGYAEDAEAFASRASDGLALIEQAAREHPGGDILVVSHGGMIQQLMRTIDPDVELPGIRNASISTVTYADGAFTIDEIAVPAADFSAAG